MKPATVPVWFRARLILKLLCYVKNISGEPVRRVCGQSFVRLVRHKMMMMMTSVASVVIRSYKHTHTHTHCCVTFQRLTGWVYATRRSIGWEWHASDRTNSSDKHFFTDDDDCRSPRSTADYTATGSIVFVRRRESVSRLSVPEAYWRARAAETKRRLYVHCWCLL